MLLRDAFWFQFPCGTSPEGMQLWVHSLICMDQGEPAFSTSGLLTTISIFAGLLELIAFTASSFSDSSWDRQAILYDRQLPHFTFLSLSVKRALFTVGTRVSLS